MYTVRTFLKCRKESTVIECKDEEGVIVTLNLLDESKYDFDVYEPKLQNFVKYNEQDGWKHEPIDGGK